MKISQAKEVLRAALLAPDPITILLSGQPGVGKTEMSEQVCLETDHDLVVEYLACADPTDGKGIPMMTEGGGEFVPLGTVKRLLAARKPTVCFFDDIGHAPSAVQNAYMHWILARRAGNGQRFPNCVKFMGATNRLTDRAGVHALHETVKSRFTTIINIEPDLDDFINWALSQDGFPIELVAFVKLRPDCLVDFKPTASLDNTCSPRTLHHAAKLMVAGIPAGVEHEVLAGAIGSGRAAELKGFLQVYRNLPDLDDILANPDTIAVPSKPDVRMALAAGLAAKSNKKNIASVVKYVDRMPDEYSVMCISMAIRKHGAEIVESKAVIAWAERHQDVLV